MLKAPANTDSNSAKTMTIEANRMIRSRRNWGGVLGSGRWFEPRLEFGREDFFFGMQFYLFEAAILASPKASTWP